METTFDIAEVAERLAVVNHAQLIGDYDRTIHVPMYDWITFFDGHTIQSAMKESPRCITSSLHLITIVRYLLKMLMI